MFRYTNTYQCPQYSAQEQVVQAGSQGPRAVPHGLGEWWAAPPGCVRLCDIRTTTKSPNDGHTSQNVSLSLNEGLYFCVSLVLLIT